MMMVATSPLSALLMIFVAVPFGIIVGIYGGETATSLRQHKWRSRRH